MSFPILNWRPTSGQLQLLESLGQENFFEIFLNWVHQELGADQCMLFFCADGQQVNTLLFKNFTSKVAGEKLAHSYITQRRYLEDPNFEYLKSAPVGSFQLLRLDSLVAQMKPAYKEKYFDAPGFQDKLALIQASGQGNYYLNLYKRNAKFDDLFKVHELESIAKLIGILISKHYQLNQQQLKQGALAFLSERERQVCQGVLQGKKNEVIAYELNVAASSVVTYRQRAYAKLGINNRAQLFALCQENTLN